MLETDGYPFKSKQHSHNWLVYKNNEKESKKYFDEIEVNPKLLDDINYIHSLPLGIKTNIKYVYGVREKELPSCNTEQCVRERERELYLQVSKIALKCLNISFLVV